MFSRQTGTSFNCFLQGQIIFTWLLHCCSPSITADVEKTHTDITICHSDCCTVSNMESKNDANGNCRQVIINVDPILLCSEGPCMSHSIILLTSSSCKCGVLFKGYPSAINYEQVNRLSLSIYLMGNLEDGSRKWKYWMYVPEQNAQGQSIKSELRSYMQNFNSNLLTYFKQTRIRCVCVDIWASHSKLWHTLWPLSIYLHAKSAS